MKLLLLLVTAAAGSGAARSWRDRSVRAPSATGNLLREISRLLTCQPLEDAALDQCSVTPVYKAVMQFTGSLSGCQTTLASSTEFRAVLEQFAGPGANCETLLEKWMFHLTPSGKQKFPDGPTCVEHVRTYEFATFCMIPGGGPTSEPTIAPTVAPAAPAANATAPNATAPAAAPAAAAAANATDGAAANLGEVSVTTPPLPVALLGTPAPEPILRKRRFAEMADMLWG